MEYRIVRLEEVTSTNDVAMASPASYREGTIITARRQTAGRGQRGNRWVSEPGMNLMFSLVLEPTHIPVERQFRISEAAALAASDAVRRVTRGAVACDIKWPNDLYVGDRKLGGILIEHSLQSEYLSRSVIGIGINVRQRKFDPSLPNPTSIANELPPDAAPVAPDELLAAFCEAFSLCFAQVGTDAGCKALHADFTARLWRGKARESYPYRDVASGERFEAKVAGVDADTGELILRLFSDEIRRYWFKEVEAIF